MIWKMNQIKLSQPGKNACDESNSNIILLWKYGKKSHRFIMLMAHQKNDSKRIIDVCYWIDCNKNLSDIATNNWSYPQISDLAFTKTK